MALNEWECSYAGFTFGGDTAFSLLEISGLLNLPDVASADHPRLRGHGSLAGDTFGRGRVITCTLDLVAKTAEEFSSLVSAYHEMSNPFVPESPLVMRIPTAFGGAEVQIDARPRRRELDIDLSFLYRNTVTKISFLASDPYIQAASENSTDMVLASASGGRTYDRTYNRTYGVTSSGGSALLSNSGNAPADLVFTFTGPLTKPKVTLLTTGEYLEFDITLSTGQQLVVDTKSMTALLEGTASRYSTLTEGSTWWKLPAESLGSSVSFTAQLFEAGTVNATYRSTYV